MILFIWNALKFILIGPASLAHLIRAHLHEAAERRHIRRQSEAMKSARYATIGS